MVTGRSGASVGVPGRSPAVNVINITRHPDGGIVNVEMKRQEGLLNPEGNSHPSAAAGSPLRGAVPINVYRQPAYYAVVDQQANAMSVQASRKVSPNVSAAQLHNVDSHLDWSSQQLLAARQQRMPGVVGSRSDQQRVPPSSNHVARPVVDQHMLHGQVNDALLPQYAHILPASDVRLMTTSNAVSSAAVPSLPVHMEATNGGISYRPVQMGNDSSSVVGRVLVDPKLGNVPPQLISRLPGLQYDVVPPRSDGPSEAERKVAVLTQQLENEMRLTTPQQGPSLWPQPTDTLSQYRSPPPYYGPHITANMKMSTPSNPVSNAVTAAGGDSDVASKKAADMSVRQVVTSLSGGLTDVPQPLQSPIHHGSDLDVAAECYGTPVLRQRCCLISEF